MNQLTTSRSRRCEAANSTRTADKILCYHGGAFFSAIGDEFDSLERRHDIIAADVLDAWFPPSPQVIAALTEDLPWLLRTSPPTQCEGMACALARARGVTPENILPAAGSSDAIFLAFRHWLNASSRVLILDPTYGEYVHVLEQIVGCRVDRLQLHRDNEYRVVLDELEVRVMRGYDLIVLVNPNSPTGQHIPRAELEKVLALVPRRTKVWVDETYIEYAEKPALVGRGAGQGVGTSESVEHFASASANVIVCKSMSKVYALSGVRAAYLCGPAGLLDELRGHTPPWAVSLPGQVAAVAAVQDPDYYAARYAETHQLREQLRAELCSRFPAWEVLPGIANFVLCHLPRDGLDAATMVRGCRAKNLFLRDAGVMGSNLGFHAIRIAVKDLAANHRILNILEDVTSNDLSRNERRSKVFQLCAT